MKIEVDLDFEEQLNLTRKILRLLQEDLEEVATNSRDLEVWEAINILMSYICTKEELMEFLTRPVNEDFRERYFLILEEADYGKY